MSTITDGSFKPYPTLTTRDFPSIFINKAHPEDFIPSKRRVCQKFTYRERNFLRIPFVKDGQYIPMTFICDKKRPYGLYLGEKARKCVQHAVKYDSLGFEYIEYRSTKQGKNRIMIEDSNQPEVNFIGLKIG